ncbi:hypothetical protein [Kitasatospora sp. NPDC002965]|uniref:hypothetical protein n=1 Tax=Kitasatospora sp. NPDC002965 TaxID=3154775 RepID=UPI00339E9E61
MIQAHQLTERHGDKTAVHATSFSFGSWIGSRMREGTAGTDPPVIMKRRGLHDHRGIRACPAVTTYWRTP